jgi:hypothetical protein
MPDKWKAESFSHADKTIVLVGPSDGFYPQRLYLDFDDVNHPEIERRVPLIVEALNGLGLEPPE